MVYIKITKIALSYPRFQFSFQGAFDTVEVLRKPPAASTTPAAPPPALPLPVPSGAQKTARVHARRSAATTRTRLRVAHSFLPL